MLHYGSLKVAAKRQKKYAGAALQDVHALLCRLIKEFSPDAVAVESVFTALNMRTALRLAISYAAAAILVTGSLLVVYRLEEVDLSQAWFYTAHTVLDSTPDSWLTPECQANPTENCREADGLTYFGPADLHAGVVALANENGPPPRR